MAADKNKEEELNTTAAEEVSNSAPLEGEVIEEKPTDEQDKESLEEKIEETAKKVEEKVEKNTKNFAKKNKGFIKQVVYVAEGAFGIFFTIVWLVLVNLFWRELTFLTDEFDVVLLLINVSAAVNLMLYLGLIILRKAWYKSSKQLVELFFSFVTTFVMWRVFPFDFEDRYEFVENLLPYLLVIVMIAIVVGAIAEFVKLMKAILKI